MNTGFNVERWFAPFVHKWLEHLGERTLEWVTNAVKADNFEPVIPPGGGDELHNSSSIADLFSAVYQELDFIKDLGWSNVVQNALFLQAFAKVSMRFCYPNQLGVCGSHFLIPCFLVDCEQGY